MSGNGQLLLWSPIAAHREKLEEAARSCGVTVFGCRTVGEVLSAIQKQKASAIFLDDALPEEAINEAIRLARSTPLVLLSRLAGWDRYFAALEAGAFDLIASPPDPCEAERVLRLAISESRKERPAIATEHAMSATC